MKIIQTKLEGVVIIEPKLFYDHRGHFFEGYNQKIFRDAGMDYHFVQDNYSYNIEAGTLRGLHFQLLPKAQIKMIRCLSGAIMDVVVDIRKKSPTYGLFVTEVLTEKSGRQILVPKGFAHGFITLIPNTEVMYKVDDFYSPEHDRSIRWDDPEIGIGWPFTRPIISEKDEHAPYLKDVENNFVYGEF